MQRKRRLVCSEAWCLRKRASLRSRRRSTPRARVTERLRQRVAMAIGPGNQAVSEVAVEYDVSWPTAHKALVVAATKWLPEPPPPFSLRRLHLWHGRSSAASRPLHDDAL